MEKNRIKIIKSYVDQSISIFPFEKQWFENNGVSVEFFGHPLADEKHVNESTKEFLETFIRYNKTNNSLTSWQQTARN